VQQINRAGRDDGSMAGENHSGGVKSGMIRPGIRRGNAMVGWSAKKSAAVGENRSNSAGPAEKSAGKSISDFFNKSPLNR
jgi:hypothetical protein